MARIPRGPRKGGGMEPVGDDGIGSGPEPIPGTEPGGSSAPGRAGPADAGPIQADAVLDAAFRLFGERGWRNTSLADVAQAAGVSLAELYVLYPSRERLLAAFTSRIDRAVLADASTEALDESTRDRLFDLLMRRFDALLPYKPAVRVLSREAARDPLAVLCGGPRLLRSMAWTLEAAGLGSFGLSGLVRTKALAGVYLGTMRTWLSDESVDQAQTMAALDRNLGRAARWLRL